jgi:ABC-type transporter Mla MlaB component
MFAFYRLAVGGRDRRILARGMQREGREENLVLRITLDDSCPVVTLKVEGKLVGPWAAELGNTWQDLWASAKRKPLRVDLSGVSFVDSSGERILRQIVRATGAELCADTPLTRYFANRAKSDLSPEPLEEK